MPRQVYPGRDFITTPESIRDRRWSAMLPRDPNRDPLPCLRPADLHGISLPDPVVGGKKSTITLAGRCRTKCENCLKHRQRLWTARAIDEVMISDRTWFGTLTVSPDHRWRYEMAADLLHQGDRSSEQHANLIFRCMADALGKEVTKMFKRMRAAGAQFRYLLVAEAHQDGFPHFHLLIHETGDPIRKRSLDTVWPLGFAQWRLVSQEPRSAGYVCKYLSKSALTRVRGSQRYGQAQKMRHYASTLERAASSLGSLSTDEKEKPKTTKE